MNPKFELEFVKMLNMLIKQPEVIKAELIGSSMYLDNGEDVDILVLVKQDEEAKESCFSFEDRLRKEIDTSICGQEYDDMKGIWTACRKDHVNLIITHDQGFYDRFVRASEICKALNLTEKGDRIIVCQMVRDGVTIQDARKAAYRSTNNMRYLLPVAEDL